MNNKITTSIVFDHHGRARDGQKGQLEIRVTYNRKSYHFGTGVRVYRREFAAGMVCNCPGAASLNKRINILYERVNDIVNDCLEQRHELDIPYIRHQVWRLVEAQSDEPTLINWMQQQLPLLGVSDGTLKHYQPLINRLSDYGKILKWRDVTTEAICEFDAYLHSLTKPQSDAAIKAGVEPERLSDAAVYNYHKCFKAMLNRADKFGKIDRNPYERLKGHFKRGEKESVEYLTEDEMQRFEALETPPGALTIAHDLFVVQMYTGLPYSDMQAFDIHDYKKVGETWQNVGKRIKTGVPYVSVLLPPVIRILEKYGWQIPTMSNADYNRHLKSLGVMAKINTRLHSHLARHTFATYMLANGAKIENVSRMLGHTNIVQTQRYAKVLAQSVHDEFDKIAEKLKDKGRP